MLDPLTHSCAVLFLIQGRYGVLSRAQTDPYGDNVNSDRDNVDLDRRSINPDRGNANPNKVNINPGDVNVNPNKANANLDGAGVNPNKVNVNLDKAEVDSLSPDLLGSVRPVYWQTLDNKLPCS